MTIVDTRSMLATKYFNSVFVLNLDGWLAVSAKKFIVFWYSIISLPI